MFGKMGDMMRKIEDAQKKVADTKERLDTVFVDGISGNGMVVVTATANREIKNIAIDASILEDKEALEDYLILATNDAIQKATAINEQEMTAVAKENMPNIPGMDLFK